MASIRPLPESVRSLVRSGIFLFDSTRVVEELVFNSLDAGANKVSVFVSIGSCYVKVVDDGGGITRDGLELVGERYATSKLLNLAEMNETSGNFGFRGEALASISEVSLLEIVTKSYGRPNGYRKVLKGCKCLYLGIDDDRKEVGTTVVIRDLFYNQPVRRKYTQSSPNKALQSIKKCVLRLALVRPYTSFKVVDIEREDELCCTHPASSPLSLLTSGFGVEVSSCLQAVEVENDNIKLSGYITGPCNASNMKALQYVYVNSQFTSKGPIHKLLGQLAIEFEHLNSLVTDNEFQSKKRSRSQPCPAYILNLICPRSLYDLTYEPSKTYVQFKDWVPILNFVEKAIKQFWRESIDCGEFSNQGACKVQEDQPWIGDVKIISAETDKSKFGGINSKNCQDLFFSTSDKMIEDDYQCHQSNRVDVRASRDYLHNRGIEMFKEQQTKRDFLCQSDCSGNLLDGSYAKSMSTVIRKHNSLMMYDNSGQSSRDYFLDGKLTVAGSSYRNVPFDAPSSSRGRKFLELDNDAINESFPGDLLDDCHGLGYDEGSNGDFQNPFLKSCSLRGSILHEKALFVNDGHEHQTDSFWSKQSLGEYCESGKDFSTHPCPEVVKKLKMSGDFDFSFRGLAEENYLRPDSSYCAIQTINSGSDDLFLNLEQHHVYQESLATAWSVDHTVDTNDIGGVSRCYKRFNRTNLLDDEGNEWDFSYNMSRNSTQFHSTFRFENTEFDFDGAVDCNRVFNRLADLPDYCDVYSTKRSDVFNDKSDWLLPESCVENCKRPNKNKGKVDHFRHPVLEKNHERSRRSYSAPPFHRRKRIFLSLNQPSEMIPKRPTGRTINTAFNHQDAVVFKYAQQSPGALHSSTEDILLQKFKSNVKQRSDVLEDTQLNDISKVDGFGSFNIQSNAPVRELFLREVQDSMDGGTKWRSCSPQVPKDTLVDSQSHSNILDISSGFLHLAGDSLIPETISKKCLEGAKVLYQVDKKFIPVVAGKTLAVIDQHAADERIRLEELRHKVLSGEAKSITYLDAEQELVLPEIGYQLLHNYSEQIKDWGWICNIHAQNPESFKRNLDILNKQPVAITLIAVPCVLGVNLNDADLLEFLQQLADTDGSSTMPPSVIRVLNLKACRGAIMFGDSLLPSECSLIVEELKKTSLCFQCAHGRPTTVPLVNLESLHNQIAKLGLRKESSNDKWHGLHRHRISVERASERLSSARGS